MATVRQPTYGSYRDYYVIIWNYIIKCITYHKYSRKSQYYDLHEMTYY